MEPYIPVITKNRVVKIYLQDIVYIMKKQRKIVIVAEKEQFAYYGRMEIIKCHVDQRFFFCLQNFVINLDKVDRMEDQTIYFVNGETFWLGRDNYVRAKQYYTAYLKKLL